MTTLTRFEGWDFDTTIAEDPRVRDLEIAERAGLARPRTIREVIRANAVELAQHGALRRHRRQNPESHGKGRPTEEYWLNEDQAYAVIILLRTEAARSLRVSLVKLFGAYRRNLPIQAPPPAFAPETAPVQARIGDDVRARALVAALCRTAATVRGDHVARIQGIIRRPWGTASIYRIPLNALDRTIFDLQTMIANASAAPKLLGAAKDRQLGLWSKPN